MLNRAAPRNGRRGSIPTFVAAGSLGRSGLGPGFEQATEASGHGIALRPRHGGDGAAAMARRS